ncbi:hypothetical protein [Archangium lansingense]|uniref:Uncharacterized protein n=1 Tax=Archangium lansingense TaxID=2995310 RepID=A0ABT3ZZD6_9BACT|nr:hypothetical protein [Archangium lansinium]MCY1074404.1 hypothetical protein [Archangium lansinium]
MPRPHIYFELSVMGFASGGLTYLSGKETPHEVLKGFSRGDPEVVYRFTVPACSRLSIGVRCHPLPIWHVKERYSDGRADDGAVGFPV